MRTKPVTYRVPSTVSQVKVLVLRDASIIPSEGDTPEKISNFMVELWKTDDEFDPSVESLWVVFVNARRRITGCQKISDGTHNTLLVAPGEIFKPAIMLSAAAIVLVHNHPSGDNSPSEADIKITRDMIRAGQLLKIEVLDHVIVIPEQTALVSTRRYSSLRELGCFY